MENLFHGAPAEFAALPTTLDAGGVDLVAPDVAPTSPAARAFVAVCPLSAGQPSFAHHVVLRSRGAPFVGLRVRLLAHEPSAEEADVSTSPSDAGTTTATPSSRASEGVVSGDSTEWRRPLAQEAPAFCVMKRAARSTAGAAPSGPVSCSYTTGLLGLLNGTSPPLPSHQRVADMVVMEHAGGLGEETCSDGVSEVSSGYALSASHPRGLPVAPNQGQPGLLRCVAPCTLLVSR